MSVGLDLEFRVAGLVMSDGGVRVGVQGHRCWAGLVMSVFGVGVGSGSLALGWISDVCLWGGEKPQLILLHLSSYQLTFQR